MAKAKISVTIEESLLERLREITKGGRSRSEIVQNALESWLIENQAQNLAREVEAYYRTMGSEEQNEDSAWAALSQRHVEKVWK